MPQCDDPFLDYLISGFQSNLEGGKIFKKTEHQSSSLTMDTEFLEPKLCLVWSNTQNCDCTLSIVTTVAGTQL